MQAGYCRSCNAAIWWVVTSANKRMPLDRGPVPDGNVVIDEDGRAVYLTKGAEAPGPRYVSHFATCPFAASHRKR